MRSKLIAALIAVAISGTAHAQSDPVGVCKDPRGCTDSGGGNSTDSYPTIFGTRPLIEDLQGLFGGQEERKNDQRSAQERARQQRLQEAQAAIAHDVSLPATAMLRDRAVTLPLFPGMTDDAQREVVAAIDRALT